MFLWKSAIVLALGSEVLRYHLLADLETLYCLQPGLCCVCTTPQLWWEDLVKWEQWPREWPSELLEAHFAYVTSPFPILSLALGRSLVNAHCSLCKCGRGILPPTSKPIPWMSGQYCPDKVTSRIKVTRKSASHLLGETREKLPLNFFLVQGRQWQTLGSKGQAPLWTQIQD